MNGKYRNLHRRAREVLGANWTGRATRPAPRLYPHQWSWDSAFIAIGTAHYDQERAQTELRSLFAGQWRNGMLPHIVFNPAYLRYKPGPEFWQTGRSPHAGREPLTSGIIQPPVHATAVRHILEHGSDRAAARSFAAEMFPKLAAWHRYLYTERNPDGDGLLYIRHPWESGQDNSPIWDTVLERIRPVAKDIPGYSRVDTEIIDSKDRPSDAEYDRYAYLVKLGYDNDYDEERIRALCPFLIKDVLLNTIAVRANRDLAVLADLLGEDPRPYQSRADLTTDSMNRLLWNEEHKIYFDYDMVAGAAIMSHVAAGFTPLYAGVPSRERAVAICARLNTHSFCRLDQVCLAVPSYDKEKPGFSPNRYWRGPIWVNINWLLYHGLRHYGLDDYARRVRMSMLKLPSECGIYEYYDPDTGRGHGANHFSWTAALVLDLLYEEEDPATFD